MARYHGKAGKVAISSTFVTEVTDWTVDIDNPAVDASYMGNSSRNAVQGQYGATGTFTTNYDPADALQESLITTTMMTGVVCALKLYELGDAGTGKLYWSFNAFITKAGEKVSVGGKITRDYSFVSDGDLTRSVD